MVGGGAGMGGGGPGGGGMMRVVGRVAARAGVAAGNATSGANSGPASPTSGSRANASQKRNGNGSSNGGNYLSITTGSCPFSSFPVGSVPNSCPGFSASPTSGCDEFDWVSVDGFVEEEKPVGFLDNFVVGAVPSVDEVENAVSAIQQVFSPSSCSQLVRDKYAYGSSKDMGECISIPHELIHRVSSAGSELDWMEPSLHLVNSKTLQSPGRNRVNDAFQLLQTEPTIQKMVVSLSSDKAVWDAVLNNEVVRELRESYAAGVDSPPPSSVASSDDKNEAVNVVKWIFDNTRAKFVEVFEHITRLVNELFGQPPKESTTTGEFEEKLRTSFLLSVVVLLVVVVTRARAA